MRTSAVNYLIAYCCLHCTDRPGFAHTITHFQGTSALSREQTLQPSSSPPPPFTCSSLLTKPSPPPPHTSFLVRSARIRVAAAFPQLVHTNYPFFPQRSSPPSSRVCRQPGEARFLSLPLSTSLSTFSCKDIAAMAVVDEDHPILFFAINLRLFLPFSLSSSDGFSFSLAHPPLISFCFCDQRANTP